MMAAVSASAAVPQETPRHAGKLLPAGRRVATNSGIGDTADYSAGGA